MSGRARKAAITGMLAALALAFSFLESLLPPLPMTPPGFKLGLSNIVTMFAAGHLGLGSAIFLAVLKGSFALFSRGFSAGMLSLSGGICSAVCVWLLWKTHATFMIIGVCSAAAHNAAQLCCAYFITATPVFFYVPVMLALSIITGALTGTVLKITMPLFSKLNQFTDKN